MTDDDPPVTDPRAEIQAGPLGRAVFYQDPRELGAALARWIGSDQDARDRATLWLEELADALREAMGHDPL